MFLVPGGEKRLGKSASLSTMPISSLTRVQRADYIFPRKLSIHTFVDMLSNLGWTVRSSLLVQKDFTAREAASGNSHG